MSHCQLTHSTSDHLDLNHSSVIAARNCFPFLHVRYNRSKSLHGVYVAKNNQTKTIWRAGMPLVDANENMFSVINMKDLHNFRKNYVWKKSKIELLASVLCALWITLVLPLFSQQYMINWVVSPASYLISYGENWACTFQHCCCMYIM